MSHALHPDGIHTEIACAKLLSLVCVDGWHGKSAQFQYLPTVVLPPCVIKFLTKLSCLHVLAVSS